MARKKKLKKKYSSFVDNKNTDFAIYQKGAIVGGLIGAISGLIIGKRIVLCIVLGAIAGGYINHTIHKDDSSSVGLKNFQNS